VSPVAKVLVSCQIPPIATLGLSVEVTVDFDTASSDRVDSYREIICTLGHRMAHWLLQPECRSLQASLALASFMPIRDRCGVER